MSEEHSHLPDEEAQDQLGHLLKVTKQASEPPSLNWSLEMSTSIFFPPLECFSNFPLKVLITKEATNLPYNGGGVLRLEAAL